MQGTRAFAEPETERQKAEVYLLIMSALAQSFILVVSWVYVMDNSELVAKHLEAVAPENQLAAGAPCTVIACICCHLQPQLPRYRPAHAFVAVLSIATLAIRCEIGQHHVRVCVVLGGICIA